MLDFLGYFPQLLTFGGILLLHTEPEAASQHLGLEIGPQVRAETAEALHHCKCAGQPGMEKAFWTVQKL